MKKRDLWRLGIPALTLVAASSAVTGCFDTSGLGDDDSNDNGGGSGSGAPLNTDASTDASSSASDVSVGDAGCATTYEGVCNGDHAIDVAAGQNFGCALLASGSVWCWGSNNYGQVGQAPVQSEVPPTKVEGVSNVTSIRAGSSSVCALEKDGTVWCWGNNSRGMLGHDPSTDPLCNGNFACNPTPTAVPKAQFMVAIAGNYSDACAINTEGTVFCWGDNSLGQLGFIGDGGSVPSLTPVTGLRVPSAQLANGSAATCLRSPSDGQIYCLGSNLDDGLGHAQNTHGDVDSGFGYPVNPIAEPVSDATDSGVIGFSDFCYGALHGCGLVGGSATCWGQFNGPNGIYQENPSTHPVTGTEGATQVACGAFHSCILQGSQGDVLCWGNNWDFAVGTGPADGGTYGAVQNPTPVGIQAVLVRGGYGQTLAIDHDGAVWQWGGGGAFADASTQPTPRKLEGLP